MVSTFMKYMILIIIFATDPPTIELSTTEIDAVEGQNITLTCTATNDVDSPYDAQVSWLGPTGQVITNNNRNFYISNIKLENVVTSALKMKPINHKQTGINKCIATNHPSSSTEMNFTITVECKYIAISKYHYVYMYSYNNIYCTYLCYLSRCTNYSYNSI